MTSRIPFAALALTVGFGAFWAGSARAEEPETKRDELVVGLDTDGDQRLDKKEMKNLKKGYPKMYESLMEFCEDALEHPKKNGVELPADPSNKDTQCKKKHVAEYYLDAWTALGQPLAPPPPNPEDKVHEERVDESRGHAIP